VKRNHARDRRAAGFALASWSVAFAIPIATAQTLPTVQAKLEPTSINLAAQGGQVKVTLSAVSGDLKDCSISNVHIGPTAPVSVNSSAGGRTYVAEFNKSDLSWLPAFESLDIVVTGAISCPGAAGDMIARGSANVMKPTSVQATVKPIIFTRCTSPDSAARDRDSVVPAAAQACRRPASAGSGTCAGQALHLPNLL